MLYQLQANMLPWVQDPSPAVGSSDRGTVCTGACMESLGWCPSPLCLSPLQQLCPLSS